ncbi:MAG: ASCH domain-containing protein [Candidatus Bathyarchaeales archaeon]
MAKGGLIFKREQLAKILSGEKTVTRRYDDSFEVDVDYAARANLNEKACVRVLITAKYKQQLGAMTLRDARKEGFRSLEAFKKAWKRCYHDWKPESWVWVYEFRVFSCNCGARRL